MTYENDFDYPPLRDPDHNEPDEQPPLNLAEIEDAYKVVFPNLIDLGPNGERLTDAIPHLLAELRAARIELDRWQALTAVEHQYATTEDDQAPADGRQITPLTYDQANAAAATGAIVWATTTYTTGWERHTAPPF